MELSKDRNQIWQGSGASTETYPEEGYNNCFDIEENSFWFRHRNEVIIQTMKNFPFKGDLADIGGGNGYQAYYIEKNFPGKSVYLVEPGYQGCLNARNRGLVNVYNLMFAEFPFSEKNIHAACLFDVIEHIEDDTGFLTQLSQFLPRGSLIYITVPAYEWLRSDVDDFGHHFRRYNLRDLENLAHRCGLDVIYKSYFFKFLVPLTYVLRHIPYKFGKSRTAEQIIAAEGQQHSTSGFVEKTFNYFQKKELDIFKKKGRISFGASCITVFQTK